MNAEWEFWHRSLAGQSPEIHADEPQHGYYKARLFADGPFVPVAIWEETPYGMACRVGYRDLYVNKDPYEIWLRCAQHPVSYAAYQTAIQTHAWPDPVQTILFDEAEKIIAESDDGGELEQLAQRLEAHRKDENSHHLDAKRVIDGKHKRLQEKIVAKLKALKELVD